MGAAAKATVQTPSPKASDGACGGGVAIGWPGVDSPRLRKAMGLDCEKP